MILRINTTCDISKLSQISLRQDLARVICLIDVRFDKAASDWITLQEEFSSCKFGALQGIKVVRAGSYHTIPENHANDFEKV